MYANPAKELYSFCLIEVSIGRMIFICEIDNTDLVPNELNVYGKATAVSLELIYSNRIFRIRGTLAKQFHCLYIAYIFSAKIQFDVIFHPNVDLRLHISLTTFAAFL